MRHKIPAFANPGALLFLKWLYFCINEFEYGNNIESAR